MKNYGENILDALVLYAEAVAFSTRRTSIEDLVREYQELLLAAGGKFSFPYWCVGLSPHSECVDGWVVEWVSG